MNLKGKLISGFIGLASLGAFLGIVNFRTAEDTNNKYKNITEETIYELIELDRSKIYSLRMTTEAYSSAFIQSELQNTIDSPEKYKQAELEEKSEWFEAVKKLEKSLAKLIQITTNPERKALYKQLLATSQKLDKIAKEILELKESRVKGEKILLKQEKFEEAEEEFIELIDRLLEAELEELQIATQTAETSADLSIAVNLISTVIVVIVSILLAKLLEHTITKPIFKLKKAARDIGAGNLDTRVDIRSRDEIGFLANSFNWMAEQLKESNVSKSYVDLIINSLNEALIILDGNNKIKDINSGTTTLTGYNKQELIGKSIEFLFKENRLPQHLEIIRLDPDRNWREKELELFSKNTPRSIPVALKASVLQTKQNNNKEIICLLQNISSRKQYEQQLINEKEAALEAANIKSQFLANVSHEIRTPINGVLGMTELLMTTDLSKKQRDCVNALKNSGQHLLTAIEDILDLSQLEAGKMNLLNHEFDIYNCIKKVIDLFEHQAYLKKIELKLSIDKNIPETVRGDARRLRQVLINLIGNAIKFTDIGEVLVEMSMVKVLANNNKVLLKFTVKDTGIGIPEERLEGIFQSFFQLQLDDSTNPHDRSTGLGLAICQELVYLMGGEIGVQSEVDRGSTFWFTATLEPIRPIAAAKKANLNPYFNKV